MVMTHPGAKQACGLEPPRRNRYFHGKMMDVFQFELETEYLNAKRWLLNWLVTGYGVVCGLDVRPGPEGSDAVVITPGLAIDRYGREILVDAETRPIPIPSELLEETGGGYHPEPGYGGDEQPPGQGYGKPEQGYGKGGRGPGQGGYGHREPEEECWVHVLLCYHECLAEPALVMAGDCCHQEPCEPGVIRERYKVLFRPGKLDCPWPELVIPDVVSSDGRIDYSTLARWVSNECPRCPEDPCIPLANLRLVKEGDRHRCHPGDIDISVRPIVYSNELLFQLLLSSLIEAPRYRRENEPRRRGEP